MKKILILIGILGFTLTSGPSANALAGFSTGRIIDDAIFTNAGAMTSPQIQAFLNSKVPSCDTYGTQPSEFGGGTRSQWASAHYSQSTFTCLRDYVEGGRTAAQIIYDTAQNFGINPQVLIVLLQKEQGLVTDDWPLNYQYRTATGYGCPDTAPCDTQYYGLTNQLTWSARMFRAILNNSPTWYTPYILGNNYIQYSPDASCGGSTVNIQNRATQALYNYTPYQPNQAALNAGYGTAPCGAYGNRNFFLYFRDWFGSPTGITYSWSVSSFGVYADSNRTQRIDSDGTVYMTPGQTAYVRVKAHNTGVSVWSNSNLKIGTVTPNPILRDSSWLYQDRAAYLSESSVTYDGTGTFDFAITAPASVGNYYQNYSLVIDGVTWFDGPGLTLLSKTVTPTTSAAFTASNMLATGATLTSDQVLYSPDKNSVLRFENGQVSLYANLKLVWSTGTPGSGGNRLVNQSDGNLVLYNANNQPVWASNTNGSGALNLKMQSDGNLVMYTTSGNSPVWATNTSSPTSDTIQVNDTMGYNYELSKDQMAMSLDRKYKFILQSDGNLVLYGPNKALWATGTDGKGGDRFVVQPDGNSVLYNAQGRPIWASNTDGRGPSALIVQMDGNLVMYGRGGASWATNTNGQ